MHRLAAFLTLALTPLPAFASDLRFTTVIDEKIDGAQKKVSSTETELVRLLLEKGVSFVDAEQSKKIRSVTDAGKLLEGGPIPDVITALDADVIIAGHATLTHVKSELLGPNVMRYDANVELKAISVDTGGILAAMSISGEGLGYSAEQASTAAAKKAASKLVADIVNKVANAKAAGTKLEVSINGLPDVTAGERVLSAIEKIPGVTHVKMLQAGQGASKLTVESKMTARQLAVALDGTSQAGLRVFGYTERAIKAEYDVSRGAKLTLLLQPMKQTAGEKRHAWQSRAIPEIVGTSLASSGLLTIKADAQVALPTNVKAWKTSLEKADIQADRAIVLEGSYRVVKSEAVEIQAKLIAPVSGILVASMNASCPAASLQSCAAELGQKMSADLKKQLETRRDLFKLEGTPGAGGESKPLEIVKIAVENIFPAKLATYTNQPIGTITLKNGGKDVLDNVVVNVDLPGFMKAPLAIPAGKIPAKGQIDVPIKVVLDRDMFVSHDENRPAVLSADVEYSLGEYRIRQAQTAAVVIYDRNALNWKTPESVATFVTSRADEILKLARSWHSSIPEQSSGHPLSTPLAIFRGLGDRGLKYVADPLNPFGADTMDYVQYPVQTLVSGHGDCDDLAVLYAALSESVGVPALLVTTPGHVFAAVPAGVPPQSAFQLSTDPNDFITHDGKLWVPIETTKVGKSFDEAWKAAVKEIGKWKSDPTKMEIIDLHAASTKYPSTNLIDAGLGAALVAGDSAKLMAAVGKELGALESRRKSALDKRLSEIDSKLKKQKTDALLTEKALVLAQTGKNAEAQALLQEIVTKNPNDTVASNNLGNLEMMAEHAKEAQQLYKKTLAQEPKNIAVRLNAALAALVVGDENEFADHIVACMEAGAEEAVLSLAQAGYAPSGSNRGADESQLVVRDLELALQKAISKSGRKVPQALTEKQSSKAAATADARPISNYLFWLSTGNRL
jgi:tetratricopeptide (TPR) repeat protein